MVQIINVIKKWQHHPTVVPIQQEEWVADASIVPTQFIKVFQHLHQKSSCDASFGQSPIKAGNVLPLEKKTGRSPMYEFFVVLDAVAGNVNACFHIN